MSYTVRIKEFEGPLELLFNLIDSKKLSINEVSLGSVTEEYFSYLNTIKEQKGGICHEEVASFLVIAATLMLVKSRSLLPGFAISEEEEEDIKELENRLQTYKAIKEMAEKLGKISKGHRRLYTRSPAPDTNSPVFLPPDAPIDLEKMLLLLQTIIQAIPKKTELPQKTVKKVVSIEEKIKELERRIREGVVKTFDDFVGKKKEKLNVIVSFLAMLELIKIGSIAVAQTCPFDLIHIEHGKRENN